jgi:tetratricopeptide (TPR) repeat protein
VPGEGGRLHGQARYADAAEAYARCVAATPHQPAAHFNLGVALQSGASHPPFSGRIDEAIAAYRAAAGLDAAYLAPRSNAAAVLKTMGRAAEAVGLFAELAALEPSVDTRAGCHSALRFAGAHRISSYK